MTNIIKHKQSTQIISDITQSVSMNRKETWIKTIQVLNEGKVHDAKMLYLETTYIGDEWEKTALLAYILAREKYEAHEALKILDKIKIPEQAEIEDIPSIVINAELAILYGILAANTFGKVEEGNLKKAEYFLSKVPAQGATELPEIQTLQLNRVLASILFLYKKFDKALEIALTTKAKWEHVANGSLCYSHDIPCLLNLIDSAKHKIMNEKLQKISEKDINENNDDKILAISNATVKLDFSRYVDKAKEIKKKTPCNELWSEIAGNQSHTGAKIQQGEENKISHAMINKLKLDSADLSILKNEYNDDIPRIPIIIEKRIILSGDFIVTNEISSEVEINKYLSDIAKK